MESAYDKAAGHVTGIEVHRMFTREEVADAIREGISLVTVELDLGERDTDLLTLTGHAQLAKLANPTAGAVTLNKVIKANYQEPPAVVRKWWDWS